MTDQATAAPDRRPLTKAQFVMLRSLSREGSWIEGDHPLWKVSRKWGYSPDHHIHAMDACRALEAEGLVESSAPLTCCEVHRTALRFTLSSQGEAMLARINSHRRAPNLGQWLPSDEILALAQACVVMSVAVPQSLLQLILVQAQREHALRLGSYQERFVKLVKSARKVAGGRSERDLAELDGVLRSSTSVPLEFADSIASVLKQQPRLMAVPDRMHEPTQQEKILS